MADMTPNTNTEWREREGATLDEARSWVVERSDDGVNCPCCEQRVQVYRRTITSGMARAIILMWRTSRTDWCHFPSTLASGGIPGGDPSKLVYWGLIEEERTRRSDGGRAGWWRVTEDGARYVQNELRVRKYALVYNGECLGLEGPDLGIQDALGTKFNYSNLMEGR